jgi:hypothetical protein
VPTRVDPIGGRTCEAAILPLRYPYAEVAQFGRVAQLVRALASHARGQGFESLHVHYTAVSEPGKTAPGLSRTGSGVGSDITQGA